jgi:hypothetical protein
LGGVDAGYRYEHTAIGWYGVLRSDPVERQPRANSPPSLDFSPVDSPILAAAMPFHL